MNITKKIRELFGKNEVPTVNVFYTGEEGEHTYFTTENVVVKRNDYTGDNCMRILRSDGYTSFTLPCPTLIVGPKGRKIKRYNDPGMNYDCGIAEQEEYNKRFREHWKEFKRDDTKYWKELPSGELTKEQIIEIYKDDRMVEELLEYLFPSSK